MCRLFAQISDKPRSAVDLLIDSEYSLLKQSRSKKSCLQRDGWGLAWYDAAGKAVVKKSPNPIYKEEALLRQWADEAVSPVVLGHIRAASNPLKLNKQRLITQANCQPYTDGHWIFAHNGTLSIPKETAAALGKWKARIQAENDSEVWFWHLRKHLEKAGSFSEAAMAAMLELWDIWDSCKKKHPGLQGPYTSLNVVASDGKDLYALCHAAGKGLATYGLCHPDQPWSQMSFTKRPGRVVVASEGYDAGSWTLMRPPEILTVRGQSVERLALTGLPQMTLPSQEAVPS